jgi:lipoate-protein ligase A
MDNFFIKHWYIWQNHPYSGAFNMQIDHFLACQLNGVLDRPLLRFFTWDPYCISLGYHQKEDEINQELCDKVGYDIVRRPTGGRAILHAEELTYSVIYPFKGIEIVDSYRMIHLPFVSALCNLNIPAEFRATQVNLRNVYKTEKASLCFASSAKYEVEVKGKKIIGSAQRVYEHSILQHGSLLLGSKHEQIIDFINLSKEKKETLKKYIKNHTTYIWQYFENINSNELAQSIQLEFEKIFNITFTPIEENPELKETIDKQNGILNLATQV